MRNRVLVALIAIFVASLMSAAGAVEVVSPADCDPEDANPCIYDALKRAAANKTDVVLLPGVYAILHAVPLVSGVSILGTSDVVIRPSPHNDDYALLFFGEKVSHIRIEGVTFEGGGQDFPSEGRLIILDGTQNVVLHGVTIRHARGKALAIYSDNGVVSSGNGIENSLIFDIGNYWRTTRQPSGREMGVDIWDEAPLMSQGNFVKHNIFRDMGLDAVHITGQRDLLIEGNFFELENEQPDVLDVGDFPAAILVDTSFNVTIRDNTIHKAMGNCIDMPGVAGAILERNLIVECGQSGIGIFQDYDFDKMDSSGVVIRNNIILNGGIWKDSYWQAGITIAHGKPTDIVISDNIITDLRPKGKKTQDYGIEVVNDAGRDIVTKVKKLVIDGGNRLDGNQRARTHGVP